MASCGFRIPGTQLVRKGRSHGSTRCLGLGDELFLFYFPAAAPTLASVHRGAERPPWLVWAMLGVRAGRRASLSSAGSRARAGRGARRDSGWRVGNWGPGSPTGAASQVCGARRTACNSRHVPGTQGRAIGCRLAFGERLQLVQRVACLVRGAPFAALVEVRDSRRSLADKLRAMVA